MTLALTYPLLLFLLPLALLPLIFPVQEAQPYPSLDPVKPDIFSCIVDVLLRLLGSIAIAALVIGLSGLHRLGQSIERLGDGANIVLLFDRSASMNDTFAGKAPAGGEESKSEAARRFLKAFVEKRRHDRFGVAAFSTFPMFVLPLSDHKEATLGAIDSITLPGLALTNVGRGLAMALSMHEEDLRIARGRDPGNASRAIVLVSDGAAVIDRKMQDKLRAAFIRRPIHLYWIFLRTEGSRGIFDIPQSGDQDTPFAMPERHLNLFFQSLAIPYRAFEVENQAALEEAIVAIDKLERKPIRYLERIPQKDLSGIAYGVAAAALLLLILAKWVEVQISSPRPTRAIPAIPFFLLIPVLCAAPFNARAAELTREQVLAVIASAGSGNRPDLARRDLTGLDLSGIDFKGADLFAANMSGAMLQGANLAKANLNRAIGNAANFSNANFSGADMFAVVMNAADFTGADLSSARIIGELRNARLDEVKMVNADLGADPANQGMVPVRVDLAGASLDAADLTGSNLTHTVLTFAKLRGAILVKTRFNWAKLAGADLAGADVTDADFSNADLSGASLEGLKGVSSAIGLPAQK